MEQTQDGKKLIERSGIFESHLPDSGVEVKIQRMDYPFLFQFIFGRCWENEEDDFAQNFAQLIERYVINWTMDEQREQKTAENLSRLYHLKSLLDFQKIFGVIRSGKEQGEIDVPISIVKFMIKRFGNCIGLRAIDQFATNEEHRKGTAILQKMCQAGISTPVWISEFWHSVEFIMPLPKEQGKLNSTFIDFHRYHQVLSKSIPVKVRVHSEFLPELIEKYISGTRSLTMVGDCHGLEIGAKLIHYRSHGNKEFDEQWRRGNVLEPEDSKKQRFANGNDLCLSLSVLSGLPDNLAYAQIDTTLPAWDIQNKLVGVAAMLYVQLLGMEMEKRIKGV